MNTFDQNKHDSILEISQNNEEKSNHPNLETITHFKNISNWEHTLNNKYSYKKGKTHNFTSSTSNFLKNEENKFFKTNKKTKTQKIKKAKFGGSKHSDSLIKKIFKNNSNTSTNSIINKTKSAKDKQKILKSYNLKNEMDVYNSEHENMEVDINHVNSVFFYTMRKNDQRKSTQKPDQQMKYKDKQKNRKMKLKSKSTKKNTLIPKLIKMHKKEQKINMRRLNKKNKFMIMKSNKYIQKDNFQNRSRSNSFIKNPRTKSNNKINSKKMRIKSNRIENSSLDLPKRIKLNSLKYSFEKNKLNVSKSQFFNKNTDNKTFNFASNLNNYTSNPNNNYANKNKKEFANSLILNPNAKSNPLLYPEVIDEHPSLEIESIKISVESLIDESVTIRDDLTNNFIFSSQDFNNKDNQLHKYKTSVDIDFNPVSEYKQESPINIKPIKIISNNLFNQN